MTGMRIWIAALALLYSSRATAHGPPPAVSSILNVTEGELTLVRLTRGLAQRASDGFRLLCPESWDGDNLTSTAALPDGSALIAGERLYLLDPDGNISLHPIQPGAGVALVSASDVVYGIFSRAGQRELWRVDAGGGQPVLMLDQPFNTIAARSGELAMLAWSGTQLVLQTVALTGETLTRTMWNEQRGVAYAELRVAAEQLYVATWWTAEPWVTLGRVAENKYVSLRDAKSDIAGPVALGADFVLARDGVLERLSDGSVFGAESDAATCLNSYEGQPYACISGGARRVEAEGLGSFIFERRSLREPDYRGLSESARRDCATRWLDVKDDVAASDADAGATEAGVAEPFAPEAASAEVPRLEDPRSDRERQSGCTLGRTPSAPCGFLWLAVACAARLLSKRARKRRALTATHRWDIDARLRTSGCRKA